MGLFADVASRVDDPFFAHAIALASRARGATAPNPIVGCVVVQDGRIVGEGFHARAGGPHAEVVALADAGSDARGADIYVTLEPCSHFGRTPPCTTALIEAGITRVHMGMHDPSADAGGGADVLRSANVAVCLAPDPAPFAALNEGWLKRLATGMPFVTAKVALSLDGHPALHAGQHAAMTGVPGAEVTRRLRARSDAVMVGRATAEIDDPALTVRDSRGEAAPRQPTRVVVGRSAWMPEPHSALLQQGDGTLLFLMAVDGAGVPCALRGDSADVEVATYPADRGLRGALEVLGARGMNDVLIEPGPRLLGALWKDGSIDELVTVTAGGMAGADAPALYRGAPDRVDSALNHRFEPRETGIVGDVIATVWRPRDAT